MSHLKREDITIEYLKECFRYEDGKLFWLLRPVYHFKNAWGCNTFNARFAGKEAGCVVGINKRKSQKRWYIGIHGYMFYRSIIVYILHNNCFPKNDIDHKDTNQLNDLIGNLRLATEIQNGQNRTININNTCGYKGVTYNRRSQKYTARIVIDRNRKFLGYFNSADDAHNAYVNAAKKYFGEFANNGYKNLG
jgi:hypothetical protein